MKLTEEQERFIRKAIDNEGLQMQSLKEDLLDHLCCVIESELKEGKPFEKILQDAISDLAPNGLINIENKTIFLLNTKRIIIMKKLMYLIGLIGTMLLATGIVFKLLWLPGASVLLLTSVFILLIGFAPLYTVNQYKVAISKAMSEKMKIILGAISMISIGLAIIFKVMHLQGANVLLVIGAFVFAFGFLPFLFFTMYKKSVA